MVNVIYNPLDDCECPYFKALPPQQQTDEREFRKAGKERRYDVVGFFNSMCGVCVFDNRKQTNIPK